MHQHGMGPLPVTNITPWDQAGCLAYYYFFTNILHKNRQFITFSFVFSNFCAKL